MRMTFHCTSNTHTHRHTYTQPTLAQPFAYLSTPILRPQSKKQAENQQSNTQYQNKQPGLTVHKR